MEPLNFSNISVDMTVIANRMQDAASNSAQNDSFSLFSVDNEFVLKFDQLNYICSGTSDAFTSALYIFFSTMVVCHCSYYRNQNRHGFLSLNGKPKAMDRNNDTTKNHTSTSHRQHCYPPLNILPYATRNTVIPHRTKHPTTDNNVISH